MNTHSNQFVAGAAAVLALLLLALLFAGCSADAALSGVGDPFPLPVARRAANAAVLRAPAAEAGKDTGEAKKSPQAASLSDSGCPYGVDAQGRCRVAAQ